MTANSTLSLIELQQKNDRLQAELTQLRQENNRLRKTEAQHKSDRIGGQLRITTQPGQGTEIFVQVPL